jgi:AcrR family transcriptional regulator
LADMTSTAGPKKLSRSPRSLHDDSKASEMLPAILEIFRKRGPESFALGAIAEELGTSSRMLIYHFGSRDELLGRVMKLLRRDTIDSLDNPPPRGIDEAIQKWWSYYIYTGHLSDMQLFFHIAARRSEEPSRFTDFASTAVDGWVQFFARAIENEGKSPEFARTLGRLVIASMRGIVVDYLITNDIESCQRSLAAFRECIGLIMQQKADFKEPSLPLERPLSGSQPSPVPVADPSPGPHVAAE